MNNNDVPMKRNGKVDFLKFVFAIFIMILHLGYRPQFSIGNVTFLIGQKGDFAVTFFFIVSGYLIASSFSHKQFFADDGIRFAVDKYKNYVKWYLVAFILCALLDGVKNGIMNMVKNSFCSIPSLLLLGSLGYSSDDYSIGYYIGASWYLSALFIVQILLFPLMRRDYKRYINTIAIPLFLITFSLDILEKGDRISYAICRIVLGQLCFEAVRYLDSKSCSENMSYILKIAEAGIYLLCFVYMSVTGLVECYYGMMFIVAAGVIISFSNKSNYKVFDHPVFTFLGRVSFPMYLLHIQIYKWADYITKDVAGVTVWDSVYYPIIYVLIILISAFAYAVSVWINKHTRM